MEYPKEFDKSLAYHVGKLPAIMQQPFVFLSFVASPIIIILSLAIALLVFRGSSLASGILLLLILSPLAEIIKLITRRARPETIFVKKMRLRTFSFPSGHSYVSALAFSYCAYLAFEHISSPVNWLIIAVLITLIFMVGVSRVYLGAHFPSDVLAGWSLGIAMSALVILTDIKLI